MGVFFELVVNFPLGCDDVEAARRLVEAYPGVEIRGELVELLGPYVTNFVKDGYTEFSVHPHGVGTHNHGEPLGFDVRTLTPGEVSSIGHQMYKLLRAMSGYRAAAVGWDPECDVDPSERADEENRPPPDGLVLAEGLADELGLTEELEPFAQGFLWRPWSGGVSIWR